MDDQVEARIKSVAPIDGTNYYFDGLANIGWLPELTDDLVRLDTPGAGQLRQSAEAYIRMWERAYTTTAQETAPPATAPGSVALQGACTRDDQCESGRCSSIAGARGTCVCNEDEDCDGGFCDMGVDTKVNACVALKADNEACPAFNGDRTCRSSHCGSGRCFTPGAVAAGGTCYVDAACATGGCSSPVGGTRGTCVCRSDGDCGSGPGATGAPTSRRTPAGPSSTRARNAAPMAISRWVTAASPGPAGPRPAPDSQASPSCTASRSKAAQRRRPSTGCKRPACAAIRPHIQVLRRRVGGLAPPALVPLRLGHPARGVSERR